MTVLHDAIRAVDVPEEDIELARLYLADGLDDHEVGLMLLRSKKRAYGVGGIVLILNEAEKRNRASQPAQK